MAIKPITPRATEKAYALTVAKNVYVFNVPLTLNKNQIKDAVEKEFEVAVTGIRTVVQSGKAVRFSRGKNRQPGTTHRKDTKKAYVTLKEGDKIAIYEGAEAETTEEKK